MLVSGRFPFGHSFVRLLGRHPQGYGSSVLVSGRFPVDSSSVRLRVVGSSGCGSGFWFQMVVLLSRITVEPVVGSTGIQLGISQGITVTK